MTPQTRSLLGGITSACIGLALLCTTAHASATTSTVSLVWSVTAPASKLSRSPQLVRRVAFSPDGKLVAAAMNSFDNLLLVLDAKTGRTIRELHHKPARSAPNGLQSVAFSPDSKLVAVGASDGSVWVWEADSGKEVHHFTAHDDPVWALAFQPGGRLLATGSYDKKLRVWNTSNWSMQRELDGGNPHGLNANHLEFSPDGELLACDFSPTAIRTNDWKPLPWFVSRNQLGLAFLSSDLLATGDYYAHINIWSASARTEAVSTGHVDPLSTHGSILRTVAASPDKKTLVGGDEKGLLLVYHSNVGWEVPVLGADDVGMSTRPAWLTGRFNLPPETQVATLTQQGRTLACARYRDAEAVISYWDVPARKLISQFTIPEESGCVALGNTGRVVAHMGRGSKPPALYDGFSGKKTRTLGETGFFLTAAKFSPNDAYLYAGGKLLRVSDGKELFSATGSNSAPAAFSEDSTLLAATDNKEGIQVWNIARAQVTTTVASLPVWNIRDDIALSPDGNMLAAAVNVPTGKDYPREEHQLWVSNLTTGEQWKQPGSGPLAFSHDGRFIATGNVFLYETATGKQLTYWTLREASPAALNFTPDSSTLVVTAPDGTSRLLDTSFRCTEEVVPAHERLVTGIRFAPDGKTFVSGSEDSTVKLWKLDFDH